MSLLNNRLVMEYVNSHRLLIHFVKQNHNVPPPVQVNAQQSLIKLREYLDKKGYRMPVAKYYYNPEDERTWRFIPCESNQSQIRVSFNNPNYMYKSK
jgi:hypothetical protein